VMFWTLQALQTYRHMKREYRGYWLGNRAQFFLLKVGWQGKNFLADQNQHVFKPTWVKLQCNRHSKSALKSVLKMAKLAPSEKRF